MKEARATRAVKRMCPNGYLWLFYSFSKEYARTPIDLDDMLDGIMCMRARTEVEAIYGEE